MAVFADRDAFWVFPVLVGFAGALGRAATAGFPASAAFAFAAAVPGFAAGAFFFFAGSAK
jgi:hypothetical protein